MSKYYNIICCVLSVLLAGYIVFGAVASNRMAREARMPSSPLIVNIDESDPGIIHGFVTQAEVVSLIDTFINAAGGVSSKVNTHAMELKLNGVDNIEHARCLRLSDDRISVDVMPMRPVARIFDGPRSYYINREGKELTASLDFRADVPIVQGHPGEHVNATDLMPLIDHIQADAALRQAITSIVIEPDGDVLLIPHVRGHVINFGNPARDIDNKFSRLSTFYHRVMPVKGWDYYDTLSVKFSSQIVATRRQPRQRDPLLIADPEGDAADEISPTTMDPGLTTPLAEPATDNDSIQ